MPSTHLRRLKASLAIFLCTLVVGMVIYKYLLNCSFLDALYQTVIIVATVGSREVTTYADTPAVKLFTIVFILFGMGVLLIVISTFTAFMTDGDFRRLMRRRKMQNSIENLVGHYIICGGLDEISEYVIEEFEKTGPSFVVICPGKESPWLHDDLRQGRLVMNGDPSQDEVLLKAGIRKAKGIISALPLDKDNLFVTITARGLNPELRIVSKCVETNTRDKLLKAGADAVVSSDLIGGMRIASEMLRPAAVVFLDKMLRVQSNSAIRFEDVRVTGNSSLVGKTIVQADISRKYKLLVVGARPAGAKDFIYSPPSDFILDRNATLVVLGETDQVMKLKQVCEV